MIIACALYLSGMPWQGRSIERDEHESLFSAGNQQSGVVEEHPCAALPVRNVRDRETLAELLAG